MNNPHGGDLVGYRLRYGKEALDFSASLNPLGMPPAVKLAAIEAIEDACAYPDPQARELTAALGAKLAVQPEYIIWGNGSAELIYRCAQAARPRRALLPAPSFAEYERALYAAGCEIRFYMMGEAGGYTLDERFVDEIKPGDDMVFLCQPGNPAGQLIAPPLLRRIADRCQKLGARLFVDECFLPFVPNAGRYSLIGELEMRPNLFILGSFTKLYAMAGLRLGYGLCGDAALLAQMAQNGQPWAVSTVAQAAGLAALAQNNYVRESLALIEGEKAWLASELYAMGAKVIGGAANYLFFAAPDSALGEKLAQKGILIRDCANFRGLGPGHYRIAVRTRAENQILVAAMRSVLL